MILDNPQLLYSYRFPGECELCRKPCKQREGAHIFSAGAGRIDHPINLLSVGSSTLFECDCHHRAHYGDGAKRSDMLQIAAKREKCRWEDIPVVIHLFRRLPKETAKDGFMSSLDDLPRESAKELAMLVWRDHFETNVGLCATGEC